MPMQPRPRAETAGPFLPSFLVCICCSKRVDSLVRCASRRHGYGGPKKLRESHGRRAFCCSGFEKIEPVHGNGQVERTIVGTKGFRRREGSGAIEFPDLRGGGVTRFSHFFVRWQHVAMTSVQAD